MNAGIIKDRVHARRTEWFRAARFGMFVHFGLYSLLARNTEWVMRKERISREKYARLLKRFGADGFTARDWVAAARSAGARYMTVTAKHLDGFCLWDSRLTDYKITNTPFGRDLIAELAEECHRAGMRLMLYYSIPDWHHPAYPHGSHYLDWYEKRAGDHPDAQIYLAYLEGQIRELLTNYGRIDGIWWDGDVSPAFGGWTGQKITGLMRRLQPQAVMNNRAGFHGDFFTPERCLPSSTDVADGRHFEACDSLGSRSWGYVRDEIYYSAERTLANMVQAFAAGGNFLLNVGPDETGAIPAACLQRLKIIGNWLGKNHAAVFGARPCPIKISYWRADDLESAGAATRSRRSLFAILKRWPDMNSIVLAGLKSKPRDAALMGNPAVKLEFDRLVHGIHIRGLPASANSSLPAVLKLNFASEPVFDMATIKAVTSAVIPVGHGRQLFLPAGQARISAAGGGALPKLKFLSATDTCLGWFRISHVVTWDLNVLAPGRFEVFAETGCPLSEAGSQFKVIIDGKCFNGTVPPTADYEDFCAQPLGRLDLKKGRTIAVFLPVRQQGSSFGDFHRLILKPVRK